MTHLTTMHRKPEVPKLGTVPTMSSSQFAELLGIEKKEVNKKIRKLFGDETVREKFSPTYRVNRQVDEYHLEEVEANMFVAKHDIKHLRTVSEYFVNGKRSALPNFSNPAEAARAWANEFEQKQIEKARADLAEGEVNRLQGVCNAVTAQFTTGMTPPHFCKQLNGVNTQLVNSYLMKIGALMQTSAGYEPSSYYRDRYFKVSFESHAGKNRSVIGLTLKGAKWLYSHYINGKLPMKVGWDQRTSHILFQDS